MKSLRARFRLLTTSAVALLVLALAFGVAFYSIIRTETAVHETARHIYADAANLNIISLNLLRRDDQAIQPRQWRAVYERLGKALARLPEDEPATYLKREYAQVGERIDRYLGVREQCRTRTSRDACRALLSRLATQVRVNLQDLLAEAQRLENRVEQRIRQLYRLSSLLLLTLLGLTTLFTLTLVLPMSRRVLHGLNRLLNAVEHFRQGDRNFRLPDDGRDEIDLLSRTFNTMAEQRLNTEAALQRSESNLAEAQRIAHIGSWELDLASGRLWWSDEVYRIFEFDPAMTPEYAAFLQRVHPDDRQQVDSAYHESVAQRTDYVLTHRLLFDDGRIKHVREQGETFYAEDGTPLRSIGTVQDITHQVTIEQALRQNETRYRELVAHMSDGVAIYEVIGDGEDFIFKEHNQAGERITGLSRDDVIGRSVLDVFPGLETMGLLSVFRQVWRTGEPAHHPLEFYQDERLSLWVENDVFRLPNGDLVAIYQDVSERREAERKLHYRLRLEAAITTISTRLLMVDSADLDLALDQALAQVGMIVGADRSYLFELDASAGTFSNTHEWCASGIVGQKAELQNVPIESFRGIFDRLRSGSPIQLSVQDPADDALQPLQDFMRESGIRSVLNLPVFVQGRLYGLVGFDAVNSAGDWPDEDVSLLSTLSDLFGSALARREANRRIEEHTWYLHSLNEAAKLLGEAGDAPDLTERLASHLLELFEADRVFLTTLSEQDDPRFPVATEVSRPGCPAMLAPENAIPDDDPVRDLVQQALARQQPVTFYRDQATAVPEPVDALHIRSALLAAIQPRIGTPLVLGLHQCSRPRRWTGTEQRLLQAIAERLGLALSNRRLLSRIRENEQRLLEAERIAQLGSWEYDIPHGESIWSDQMFQVLGLAPGSVTPGLAVILEAVADDERDRIRQILDDILTGKLGTYDFVHRIQWQDGTERFLQQRGSLERGPDGTPLRILGTTQDITERVRMEHELEAHRRHLEQLVEERTATIRRQARIIDQAHESVISFDPEGVVSDWNRGSERLFGLPAEQAIGRRITELYPPDVRDQIRERILEPLRREGRHELTITMRRYDGERFAAHQSFTVLDDEAGNPHLLVAFTVDISEIRQREQELQRLTERLQASNQELESFSYSVSHDLRAPLRAIDGFSQALLEDYAEGLDETGRDYLQRVRAGARRMGRLIDDLLQLSRVNRIELRLQPVDLSAMAREIIEELRAGDPQRRVNVQIADDLQAIGDPNLLRMALLNLLGNAWKFTARTPAASIRFGRDPDDAAVFLVQDNGAGFDMRHADKLFGAFQRLHRVSDFPGSGVGLATVQRIIHRHGGRVWAEAQPGQGATFRFTLGGNPEGDSPA